MTADGPTPAQGAEFVRIMAADDAAMLTELAQIGMRLVRLVEANAEARMAKDPAADLGRVNQAFARISRSIRQTLALKAKLAEMAAKRDAAAAKAEREQKAHVSRTYWRKMKLGRTVAETIESQSSEHDAENLLTDLRERLMEPDIEVDLTLRSMGEMVASVCDEFGLPRNREIWQSKGWYLTENWRVREADEAPRTAPARSWQSIRDEALAMMEATTNPRPPDG